MPHQPPRLTVVIPRGPGEPEIAALLDQLRALPDTAEITLVHAAPPDVPVPRDWPPHLAVRQLTTAPGRARQMNLGAAGAAGTHLWFLHADTRLGPGCLEGLAAFIAANPRVLGWFDLAFRADGPALTRLNAHGANLRARWLGIPFGDQGFVLRAADFHALGGFDENLAHGEDHRLVWAARKAGIMPRRIPGRLDTSARKYRRLGWGRTTLLHVRLTVAQAWRGWRAPPLRRPPLGP